MKFIQKCCLDEYPEVCWHISKVTPVGGLLVSRAGSRGYGCDYRAYQCTQHRFQDGQDYCAPAKALITVPNYNDNANSADCDENDGAESQGREEEFAAEGGAGGGSRQDGDTSTHIRENGNVGDTGMLQGDPRPEPTGWGWLPTSSLTSPASSTRAMENDSLP